VVHQLVTPLSNGAHTITLKATDSLGHTSLPSSGLSVNVATSTAVPTVNANASASGDVSGTAAAGATVTLTIGGVAQTPFTVGNTGTWTFHPASALSSSGTAVSASATDLAGNTAASGNVTVKPDANGISLSSATDTGTVGPDGTGLYSTLVSTPTITGHKAGVTQAGTVSISIDGGTAISVPMSASGDWSYTPNQSLSVATHTITEGSTTGKVAIETGAPLLTMTGSTFSAQTTKNGAIVPAQDNIPITATNTTNVTYTVDNTQTTRNFGDYHVNNNNGNSANSAPLMGSTLAATDLGKIAYVANANASGTDTLVIKATNSATGGWAIIKITVSTSGPAVYELVADSDGTQIPPLRPSDLFNEPSLDFSKVAQLPALHPAASAPSADWQTELRSLVPMAPPADVNHQLIAQVSAPPATTVFTPPAAAQAVGAVHDAAHTLDGLGGHANPYTQLLDQTGYVLQGT
jgi:hypothetical protein